ncbi:MAG: hypothetical protein NVS1B14_05360 [Vulcanimicrobiaceae bacterium]
MMLLRLPWSHAAHTLGATAALLAASAVSAEPWIPQALPVENTAWLAQHRRNVQRARAGRIDLLFLGDSIFERWSTIGKDSWDANFGSLRVANFAVSGDRTQHLLWRMLHGELGGFAPSVCFILIGTNNLPSDSPVSVARGVSAIVRLARKRIPRAKSLLFGILPRAADAEGSMQPKVAAVNASIAKLQDGRQVFYLDVGAAFLSPSGELNFENVPDGLHPSAQGYAAWAQLLRPHLHRFHIHPTAYPQGPRFLKVNRR